MENRGPWQEGSQAWGRLEAWYRDVWLSQAWGADDADRALAALEDSGRVRRLLDQVEFEAVRTARKNGRSWAEIAVKLGVTRQSAWERWRDVDESAGTQSGGSGGTQSGGTAGTGPRGLGAAAGTGPRGLGAAAGTGPDGLGTSRSTGPDGLGTSAGAGADGPGGSGRSGAPASAEAGGSASIRPDAFMPEAEQLIERSSREWRRRSSVVVPNVVGMTYDVARKVVLDKGLVAEGPDPDGPPLGALGWPDGVVTDQSPESGAKVPPGSVVRLWLERGGGSGVREPRRPLPDPKSGRQMQDEAADESVGW